MTNIWDSPYNGLEPIFDPRQAAIARLLRQRQAPMPSIAMQPIGEIPADRRPTYFEADYRPGQRYSYNNVEGTRLIDQPRPNPDVPILAVRQDVPQVVQQATLARALNPIPMAETTADLGQIQARRVMAMPGGIEVLMEQNRGQKGFTKPIKGLEDLRTNRAWNYLASTNPEKAKQVYAALTGSDYEEDIKTKAKTQADLLSFPRETLQAWLKEGRVRQSYTGEWEELAEVPDESGMGTKKAWVPAGATTQSIVQKVGGTQGLGLPTMDRTVQEFNQRVMAGEDRAAVAEDIKNRMRAEIAGRVAKEPTQQFTTPTIPEGEGLTAKDIAAMLALRRYIQQ